MFKNKLQESAQRSGFNPPSYACVREGLEHTPRFKASININGEIFQSPTYSTTLRHAKHAAAEAALISLCARRPSETLTVGVRDDTRVSKNLHQETSQRAGLNLPTYSTVQLGPPHVPVFTSTVELAGMSFPDEAATTKAIAAWSALIQAPNMLGNDTNGSGEAHRKEVGMGERPLVDDQAGRPGRKGRGRGGVGRREVGEGGLTAPTLFKYYNLMYINGIDVVLEMPLVN